MKQADKWGTIEAKYMASCPTSGDQASVQSAVTSFTNCLSGDLAGTPGSCDVGTCNSNLTTCNGNLSTCNSNLTTCDGNLSTCNSNLTTCDGNLSSCNSNLTTCNGGTAVAADVLAGKTFSSSAGLGIMGTAPAGSNVTGANGSLDMTIPDGHYSGSKTCTAADTDLMAGNVKSGVNIFGVAGSLSSGLLKTGQMQCDQGGGTLGVCPGVPAGQDGETQLGTARSYSFDMTVLGARTVLDNVTGLEWEVLCDQDPAGATCPPDHDMDTLYTWANTFTKIAT
jgi:hypothetical protein